MGSPNEVENSKDELKLYAQKYNENSTKGVALKDNLWENGQTIRIKFLNGTTTQHNQVKNLSVDWFDYANLSIEYVESNEIADIKVAFDWQGDGVTWSYVGTEAKFVPQSQPSVNFGKLSKIDKIAKRDVLMQFGHILGLVNEHRSEGSPIEFDTDILYEYYMYEGWTIKDITNFFLIPFSDNVTIRSEYDSKSIMCWPIDEVVTINGIGQLRNSALSDGDKEIITKLYPKGYYNGYEHDLPEPNWEKLKTTRGLIGATRDMEGNYYFYPYYSGNIEKYDNNLDNKTVLAQTLARGYYRISPRIIPTEEGMLMVRPVYVSGSQHIDGVESVNIESPTTESIIATNIKDVRTYSGFIYDYNRETLYMVRGKNYNSAFEETSSFVPENKGGSMGVVYWGKKYKWAAVSQNLDSDPVFYVYGQTDVSDITSSDNLIAKITIPNFKMSNGGYSAVYEYNNKLVVVRFGGSNFGVDHGSILIIDPTGETIPSKYKIYTHSDAKWREAANNNFFCGGFYWRHKLMVYDQSYNKYYFEIPELLE